MRVVSATEIHTHTHTHTHGVGQKSSFEFFIRSYRKIQTNFLANPSIHTHIHTHTHTHTQLPQWLSGKQHTCNVEDTGDLGSIPGSGRSLRKGKVTHSSILAWRIPWTEEPGKLQSMGSQSQA